MTSEYELEEGPRKPIAVKTRLAFDNYGRLYAVDPSRTRKESKGKKHPSKVINDSREAKELLLEHRNKLMKFQSLGSCMRRAGRADEVTTRASTCSRSTTCAWNSSVHNKFAAATMTTSTIAALAAASARYCYASLSSASSRSSCTLEVSYSRRAISVTQRAIRLI